MKKENKRGQVTIFIIIAILVVAGVSLFFILKEDTGREEEIEVDPEVEPIYNYVQGCLDESVKDSLFYVSERGGYYDLSGVSTTEIMNVPYYIEEGENIIIPKTEIENQLSKSIEDDIRACVDLSGFEDYEIQEGSLSVESSIEKERIDIDMNFPINIQKGESSFQIERFEDTKEVRLGLIYEAISIYVNEQSELESGFCVDCFYDISTNYDFTIDSYTTTNNSKIFLISDFNSQLNGEELVYSFAGKF